MIVAEALLWISVTWITYTLIIYPAFSVVIGSLLTRSRRVVRQDHTPRVSFIVSAYNEEKVIEDKLLNTLALDYPADHIEIIVASDGSTDRTDEIVEDIDDPRVHLYRVEGRLGKTAATNGAVAKATGEILVFSDATGMFQRDALRILASRFANPAVGCVAGRVVYRYGRDATSKGFRGYQSLAVAMRRAENSFGDQTSVSGSIHAIRRDLYRPGEAEYSMDLVDALSTVVQGKRVVYEYDAISHEESRTSSRSEFLARARISLQNNDMVGYIVRELIAARRWFYLAQMVSHKIMRWWMWAPLTVMIVTSLFLAGQSPWYAALALSQLAFYTAGIVPLVRGTEEDAGGVSAASMFFITGNAAMFTGSVRSLLGATQPAWEPER